LAIQIQLRHDSASDWTSADPTLADGEIGIETDTQKIKLGNGIDAWTALPYSGGFNAQNLKGLSMTSPGSTEDIVLFYTDAALEITKVIIAPVGGGSIDWNILSSATRSGAGTNLFTADEVNSATETFIAFDNENVVADRFLRFIISAKTGTVSDLHLSIFYKLT
jgi:hypothetical protein